MLKTLSTAVFAATVGGFAFAAADLQITETWSGNEPGSNLTEDWFEVTNFGDMAWTIGDGALYFDDDSQDATTADVLSGITSIAPGESVVFVDDTTTTEWETVWADAPAGLQVGTYSGAGLSQGGDGVTLFFDAGDNGVTVGDIIDFEVYPDADAFGGQSFDVALGGVFSTVGNASGAFATTILNDADQPGIGSPGTVPEPASLALLAVGLAVAGLRRR